MATLQSNGSPITRTSTNNNGGAFLKGIGSNDAPISTQQNEGTRFGTIVASGVDTDSALSNGIFANESRGAVMKGTENIAGITNDFLKYAASDNSVIPTEEVQSNVTYNPPVVKTTKNYTYSKFARGVKTASAIRNNQFNIYEGDFVTSYPRSSREYWNRDPISDGLLLNLDVSNPNSYSGTGNTWYDLEGNYNATLINGVTYDSANGGSLELDGTNQYIDTGFTYAGTADYTMTVWMKANGAQKCGLIGHRSAWVATGEMSQNLFYITGDASASTPGTGLGWFEWYVNKPSETNYVGRTMYLFNDKNVCDNVWHQVVAVKSQTSTKVYVDGLLIGENSTGGGGPGGTDSIKIISDTRLVIGAAGNGVSPNNLNGFYYNGSIAGSSFYNRALSEEEVAKGYYIAKDKFDY